MEMTRPRRQRCTARFCSRSKCEKLCVANRHWM